MIKKSSIFISLICIINLFIACKINKKIDIIGTYKGVLPCASCMGIDNELILKDNKTFLLKTIYLGTNNLSPNSITGTYKVQNNQLQLIGKRVYRYQINDQFLELLDISGNKIESKLNYKLTKQ